MKKILCLILAVSALLALSSCGSNSAKGPSSLSDVYEKITESISMDYEKIELSKDDMLDYYGIESEKISDLVAVQDACGYKDEIVMIKAVDEATAEEIASLLNDHIDYQKDTMKNYDAAQYEILGSSKVGLDGVFVSMFVSSSQEKMVEIYNSFFG